MRYLILGPLEVRDGETDVELRGGQQRKLLAILLLHCGEAVSSDRLIEELWEGRPPETAAKALQGYVSSLRKQLGPETVETVGSGYRLRVASEDLDSQRFGELLAAARPLERAAAAAKLREALALWRGPALADFAYDEFAQNEIDRLEELRLGAIERRIDLELALGHHDDLVPELEALVRTYPLRERLRGHLMVALYRSGRQAEALDAYQEARKALRDELGLEPSEELQALQRAILDHDPALAAPPRVDTPRPVGVDRPQGRRMRHPLAAVAVGLAILGGTAAAVLLTQGGKAAPILVPWDSVVKINASGTRIERITGVGSHPVAIALGEGGVWVANSIDGTVSRLNPATGRRAHTPLGINADVSDIAVGFHSVWVAGGNDGTITQIDPHLNTVENTITPRGGPALAPNAVFYVATGLGYVWATRGSQLLRIDPSTGLVSRKRLTVGTPTGLTTGGGSVWVTTQTTLLRIDPRTVQEETQESVTSAADPVYTKGFLWLLLGFEVQQVDPASLASDRTITMKGYPTALASGNGALWTLSINSNSATATARLTRWPLSGGRATALEIGRGATAVAAGGGATWVAVSAPN